MSWHDLGAVDSFPEGALRGRMVQGRRLCVGRVGDTWFAMDDTCPHAGGSLCEGMIDSDIVICPLHAYGFEIDSGRCIEEPECSVNAYEVRVQDGKLQLRF